MGAAENDAADHDPDQGVGANPPLTLEVLADLQAGLLDDETAARVRRQVRGNPRAEGILNALNQVRHEVAAVGADPTSAPDVPAPVIDRISAVLGPADPPSGASSSGGAAHAARPHIRPARIVAAVAGSCAVLAAVGFGTASLLHAPGRAPSTPVTAEHITVSTPPMAIPLSRDEILGLLDRSPDYGPLSDPARLASCLSGLGYPASEQALGARPIEINARPGVLLVLPGHTPDNLVVYAVALNCSAADTGLFANTEVPRP